MRTCVAGSQTGKSGCRDVHRLGKLECDGASAVGNGKVTQKIGIQRNVEEKRWTTARKDRVELALPSNLEKEESVETRETPDQDQGEGEAQKKTQSKQREGDLNQIKESAEQETQSMHFNWSSIAKQEDPEKVLT